MATTYYATALKSRNPNVYGLLKVTAVETAAEHGRSKTVQEWTGDTFRTWDEAVAEMDARNAKLFRTVSA